MDQPKNEHQNIKQVTEKISPFELKDKLIDLAKGKMRVARTMLDAGRGNPNWIAATPREAFFALGQFAIAESRLVWNENDLAGMPSRVGMEKRFQVYVEEHENIPGIKMLRDIIDFGTHEKQFDPDKWLYELVDGIIGDNYPNPNRMLVRTEEVVHDFLLRELVENDTSIGKFDLFGVEGATAAMCYIFETLFENYLLPEGAKIAVMVPIFPPYIEIPELPRKNFNIVEIHASAVDKEGDHTWQYPESELVKLEDPEIKALFLVNPSNPPSVAITEESKQYIIDLVKKKNPNLMIISDDVYGTFVDDYRSVMADLPYNAIGVYSFSKYFGVTGWRLGTIAVNQNNVFDKLLQELPQEQKAILHKRYSSLTENPEELKFIDRIVADSRTVAMNHTAGLSTPQQVQMALFSIFALLDKSNRYKKQTIEICHRRMRLLYEGLGIPQKNLPNDADYYTEIDLEVWSNHNNGEDFTAYLKEHYTPIDILYRLAERASIVLLNGAGFLAPTWSVRVSLANLDDAAYLKIGQELHKILQEIVAEWESGKK